MTVIPNGVSGMSKWLHFSGYNAGVYWSDKNSGSTSVTRDKGACLRRHRLLLKLYSSLFDNSQRRAEKLKRGNSWSEKG